MMRRDRQRKSIKSAAKIYLENINDHVNAEQLIKFMHDGEMISVNEDVTVNKVNNVLSYSKARAGGCMFRKSGYGPGTLVVWELNPHIRSGWNK